MWGGAGNDRLFLGNGNDHVWGGSGNDRISLGRGRDRIWGGAGNDKITAGNGNDWVWGGAGNDRCTSATASTSCSVAPATTACSVPVWWSTSTAVWVGTWPMSTLSGCATREAHGVETVRKIRTHTL